MEEICEWHPNEKWLKNQSYRLIISFIRFGSSLWILKISKENPPPDRISKQLKSIVWRISSIDFKGNWLCVPVFVVPFLVRMNDDHMVSIWTDTTTLRNISKAFRFLFRTFYGFFVQTIERTRNIYSLLKSFFVQRNFKYFFKFSFKRKLFFLSCCEKFLSCLLLCFLSIIECIRL